MKIILASASPRRQELLRYIVPDFDILPADIDETIPEGIAAERSAEYLAVKKAEHISEKYPDSLVIGSDTVVIIGGEILGKPADKADAERMLRKLSGKVHTVVTGVCLSLGGRSESFSNETKVKFYPLTDEEISAYIATGEPMDKAGAYGIQGFGSVLVEGIEGDFFNVMGLPVASLKRKIEEFIK
ncbi:MAG: septum formation protein Maf [Oscillospiraceae bacterium]|nr:septum formation protein Maf [Oscillospiraceae bacterium]